MRGRVRPGKEEGAKCNIEHTDPCTQLGDGNCTCVARNDEWGRKRKVRITQYLFESTANEKLNTYEDEEQNFQRI
ncbi:hypothetical protein V5799_010187 [Amblyomma americanum]|uniref:Uncharacterized protein n=1 Tax=Amblyomma americanum TaxID=6943 RepID=A0AAQ4F8S4_AMBAM